MATSQIINWFDIAVRDLGRAMKFYTEVVADQLHRYSAPGSEGASRQAKKCCSQRQRLMNTAVSSLTLLTPKAIASEFILQADQINANSRPDSSKGAFS